MTDAAFEALEAYFRPPTRNDPEYVHARVAWRLYRGRATTAQRIARASTPAMARAALEIEAAGNAARKSGDHAARALGLLSTGRVDPEPPEE